MSRFWIRQVYVGFSLFALLPKRSEQLSLVCWKARGLVDPWQADPSVFRPLPSRPAMRRRAPTARSMYEFKIRQVLNNEIALRKTEWRNMTRI